MSVNKEQIATTTHHGGAWKVAYADFVTAMMALFMILWISAQDEEILLSTSQYFASPFNSPMDKSSGVMSGEGNGIGTSGGSADSMNNTVDSTTMNELSREFYRLLDMEEAAIDNSIEVEVTGEGLFITVHDDNDSPLFKENDTELSRQGLFILQNLAWLLDRHNMKIQIGSHAPAGAGDPTKGMGPWELTAIRSNIVREQLKKYALNEHSVNEISAYGDSQLLPGEEPTSLRNQRIEINLVVNKPN